VCKLYATLLHAVLQIFVYFSSFAAKTRFSYLLNLALIGTG